MKTLILLALIFTTNAFAIKGTKPFRKVSNSAYFVCNIERENTDKKSFKKELHFPFPTEKGESYELKSSMRWNDFKMVISSSGEVQINISEMVGADKVSAEKTHQMGKDAQFESFKVQVDLKKDELVIPYFIQCAPE